MHRTAGEGHAPEMRGRITSRLARLPPPRRHPLAGGQIQILPLHLLPSLVGGCVDEPRLDQVSCTTVREDLCIVPDVARWPPRSSPPLAKWCKIKATPRG